VFRYDAASFAAGQNRGTRVASCIAQLTASELMRDARWWNRRRRGAMATALRTFSEKLKSDADLEPAGQGERS
jgi:hypothetical protein